jgi:hypothetical protein
MKVVHARERAVLARLWIALFKSIQRDYKSFNNDFITLFVGMIVFDRSAEGRKPPTASDIARVTGFPRTTVLRHLQRMQRDGLVHRKNGGYCVTDIVNTPEALRGMQYRLQSRAARSARGNGRKTRVRGLSRNGQENADCHGQAADWVYRTVTDRRHQQGEQTKCPTQRHY